MRRTGSAAARDRDRILEIMRDSRIGSYGAVALVLVLAARLGCLAELTSADGARALIGAHALARWSSLPLLRFLPYARAQGAGKPFVGSVTGVRLATGTVLAALLVAPALGPRGARSGNRGSAADRGRRLVFPRPPRRRHRRLSRRGQPGGGAHHLPRGPGMRLLLVRHGEAEGQEGRVVGHADPGLSARGREEMAALFATVGERPAILASSDLLRARASAELLAARWSMKVAADARLRELHFGEWEGRTWDELSRDDGDRLRHWMERWVTRSPPAGESFLDLAGRVGDWLDEWACHDGAGAGTTVVVAHAGSIRAILCRLLGVPPEEAFGFEVSHARVTGIDLAGGRAELICRNAAEWPAGPCERASAVVADVTRCPLCGDANDCAIAAGDAVTECWCYGSRVPRALLVRVPEGSRGRVCVCARCAGR